MKTMWQEFADGFVGAFKLAGAMVMAITAVVSAFSNGALDKSPADQHSRLHES